MESRPTELTCPECRGPIAEFFTPSLKELRCRVGHRYSPETFLAAHADTRERTLWAAVVALEEGAQSARELASSHSSVLQSRRLEQEAGDNEKAAKKIRELISKLTQENSQRLMEEAKTRA